MADHLLVEQLDQAIDRLLAGVERTSSTDPTLSTLMQIAGTLRDLPDDGFRLRLGRELYEFTGIRTITPFITIADGARLIEFMKHTFGAVETNRHAHGPDGFVADVRIGDSALLVMGGESLRGQGAPAALHVYVNDRDATCQRALDAGASSIDALGTGEHAAFMSDPFGNYWFIETRVGATVDAGASLRPVVPVVLTSNVPPLVDFLKRAFGAKVEGVLVRIGEATVEIREVQDPGTSPFGFYMHTDDVDGLYRRAMGAGAISILPPADQRFGERLAIIQDPDGNRWFAAKPIDQR
jgi:uncharacterized glyoxalase superfamily protein PhnB